MRVSFAGAARPPFEILAAYGMGALLPVIETCRRRTDFSELPLYVDDYLLGALLLSSAWACTSGRASGPAWLVGAWGVFCGGMYYSFFGQLAAQEADPSGLPHWIVASIKAVFLATGVLAFICAARRATPGV